MKITSIQQQKKNPERVSIFLDDKFAFGLDSKFLVDFDLFKDKELGEQDIGKIVRKDLGEKIKSRVLNLIARRPRSEKEIRDYIERKFYEGKFDVEDQYRENLVESVIEPLKEYKYVDDEAFARWYVNNRVEFKPRGKRVLKVELKLKGISDDIISTVLSFEDGAELEMANRLAEKKLRTLSRLDESKQREKLIAFLQRKGFGWDVISSVTVSYTHLTLPTN